MIRKCQREVGKNLRIEERWSYGLPIDRLVWDCPKTGNHFELDVTDLNIEEVAPYYLQELCLAHGCPHANRVIQFPKNQKGK